MKTCAKCKIKQELSQFNKGNDKDNLRYYCKKCNASGTTEWRKNNPGKRRNSFLVRTYGIDLAQYNEMLKNQNHKCATCGIDEVDAGQKRLVVDHDHLTGRVRALLCGPCNTSYWSFKRKSKYRAKN